MEIINFIGENIDIALLFIADIVIYIFLIVKSIWKFSSHKNFHYHKLEFINKIQDTLTSILQQHKHKSQTQIKTR